jgi:hypothetical protein
MKTFMFEEDFLNQYKVKENPHIEGHAEYGRYMFVHPYEQPIVEKLVANGYKVADVYCFELFNVVNVNGSIGDTYISDKAEISYHPSNLKVGYFIYE